MGRFTSTNGCLSDTQYLPRNVECQGDYPPLDSKSSHYTQGMQLITPRRTGRPPKRADDSKPAMLTLRVTPEIKNLLIDMADAYDVSLAEYVTILVKRDVEE